MSWPARCALGAALVFGAGVLWLRFNAPPGSVPLGAAFTDLVNYYYPLTDRVARRLASGELPLWNPHACSGVPLLAAMQPGVFYPGTWLALLLPTGQALALRAFAELVLSGLFAAWLFRAWDRSALASAAGGILFMFGCVLGQSFWPPVVSTILWLPWQLLCIEKLARGAGARWAAGLGLGVALQILAGFPQLLVYSLLLVAPLAAARLWEARGGATPRDLARRGALIAGAFAFGAGLAAVQLLPTFELAAASERGEPLSAEEIHYLTPRVPHRALRFLATSVNPAPKFVSFGQGIGAGYLGIATPVLVVLGLVALRRKPSAWLLLALGAAALVLSDGYHGVAAVVYGKLPLLRDFRTPERLRLLTLFAAIALAVAGFDTLGRGGRTRDERRLLRHTCIAACAAVGLGMVATLRILDVWRIGVLAAFALPLLHESGSPRMRAGARVALVALLLADLTYATEERGMLRRFPERLSTRYYAGRRPLPPELIESERARAGLDRLALVGVRPHMAAGPAGDVYRPSCYGPLMPRQWHDLDRRLSESATARNERRTGVTLGELDPTRDGALLDALSVRRVFLPQPGGGGHVLPNHDALPRAYRMDRYRVEDPEATLGALAAGALDPRAVVHLDRAPSPEPEPDPAIRGRAARIERYEPERVVVAADAAGAALLVLTDTDFPGWEARVDGEPAEILRANGLYRAVALPGGSHRVEFRYAPASLRRGALVSAASAGVGLALAGLALRRRG